MQAINYSGALRLSLLALFVFIASFSFAQTSASTYTAENDGWLVNVEEAYKESELPDRPDRLAMER